MFKILPIQSKEEQAECAELCNAEYIADAFGYAMRDFETNALMGFAQFDIGGDNATLYALKPVKSADDFEAMFILGRQTLNFMEKCGAETVVASEECADITLLKAIGFKGSDDGYYSIHIKGIFDGHCKSCS